MEPSSLRERLQKGKERVGGVGSVGRLFDSDDESDVDDDITLEECHDLIQSQRANKQFKFTSVKDKPQTPSPPPSLNIPSPPHVVDEGSCDGETTAATGVVGSTHGNDDNDEGDIMVSSTHNRCSPRLTTSRQHSNNRPTETDEVQQNSDVDEDFIPHEEAAPKVKKKRGALTAEERLQRAQEKEREKEEKKRKREEAKAEKEKEKARARATKNAETMAAKSESKEQCMERMLVVMDPCLVQEKGGADILKELEDLGVKTEFKELPVVCCIGWLRESCEYTVDQQQNNQVHKTQSYKEENHILHKISAYELATRIQTENNNNDDGGGGGETLTQLVQSLKDTFREKRVTLVVVGANAYHRLVKTKQNEEFRKKALGDLDKPDVKRAKKKQLVPSVTKDEMEKHLIRVQLTTCLSVRMCETMMDFSRLIMSFTKAMAEAPFKKGPTSALQFSTVQSQNKASFKVCDDGHGILEVWNQQLQQFYGVRNDTSQAITQVYPTPLSLMRAYQQTDDLKQAQNLCADIPVRRGAGVLQTTRRIGPDLSKKLHKLFTSLDGDESLGK